MAAADLTAADTIAIVLTAPTAQVPGIAAALRQRGLSAPVRTVGNLNSVYGALAAHTGPEAAGRPRWAWRATP